MKCSLCQNSNFIVIGEQRIQLDKWLPKKFRDYVMERDLPFSLIVDQISEEEFWVLDELFSSSMDKCFECFFKICCEKFGWNQSLLDDFIPLSDHYILRGLDQQISSDDKDWRELFVSFVRDGEKQILFQFFDVELFEEAVGILSSTINKCKENSLTSEATCCILKWLNDRDPLFEASAFWDIASAGYRTEADLNLLDSGTNFRYGDGFCPPIHFLKKHNLGVSMFCTFDDALEECFGDSWTELDVHKKTSVIQDLIEKNISCDDLLLLLEDEFEVLRMSYPFDDVDQDHLRLDLLIATIANLDALRLPIDSVTFIKYFGLVKEHILYAIDNAIDESEFFVSARVLVDSPADAVEMANRLMKNGASFRDVGVIFDRSDAYEVLLRVSDISRLTTALVELLSARRLLSVGEACDWIELFGDVDYSDLVEWISVDLSPVVAREWKVAGFEPSAAKAWAREVDDPQIALRRLQAGILPPAISD